MRMSPVFICRGGLFQPCHLYHTSPFFLARRRPTAIYKSCVVQGLYRKTEY